MDKRSYDEILNEKLDILRKNIAKRYEIDENKSEDLEAYDIQSSPKGSDYLSLKKHYNTTKEKVVPSALELEQTRVDNTISFLDKSFDRQGYYMGAYTLAVFLLMIAEISLCYELYTNIDNVYISGGVVVSFMLQSYGIFHTMVKYIFSSHTNSIIESLHRNKLDNHKK